MIDSRIKTVLKETNDKTETRSSDFVAKENKPDIWHHYKLWLTFWNEFSAKSEEYYL